jgi:hypothetical protein
VITVLLIPVKPLEYFIDFDHQTDVLGF